MCACNHVSSFHFCLIAVELNFLNCEINCHLTEMDEQSLSEGQTAAPPGHSITYIPTAKNHVKSEIFQGKDILTTDARLPTCRQVLCV